MEWTGSFRKDKAKLVFYLLALLSFIFMVAGSFDAGMSGDEEIHNIQAAHVYDYYATFGADSTAAVVTPQYNLPLYGQLVDNFAYALSKWFGLDNIMQVRHTVNTVCGWLAILFTALIAYRIAGRKYLPAILTFVLFVFSPRFLGHSFNDLKDVNLVTFMAMGLFYMTVFLQDFPKVKVSTLVMLAVSIGLAMAVRVGGLILIPYLGMFGLIRFWQLYRQGAFVRGTAGKEFWRLVKYGVLASLGGYVLCVLLWPYAMKAPVEHVFGTLTSMNAFAISIRQLFEGTMQMSSQLPWYYTPKFIFMTVPVAVMAGTLIDLVSGWTKERWFWTFFLLFCFVFPVVWIVVTKANVYGGWRHSMFCYPTLVALAGLGFYSLYERFRKPVLRWGLGVVLPLVLLVGPVRHVFANHPYEYVYFNELSGGIRNAYGRYEMDYYYHSTREGVEWVMAHADTAALEPGRKIRIATWHPSSVAYYVRLYDTVHFSSAFTRIYQMGNDDWDYAVFTITGMSTPRSASAISCMAKGLAVVRAPIHSRSMPALRHSSTCLAVATSVQTYMPVSCFTSFSQARPSTPTPSKPPGLVRGFQMPARNIFCPFEASWRAVFITCSSVSALHGPAMTTGRSSGTPGSWILSSSSSIIIGFYRFL